jgi:hypothetical protein
MNPFVVAVEAVEVVEAVMEEVVVEVVMEDEEVVMAEVVMAEVVTVMEDADMVADIMEVMEEVGEVGVVGLSMAGLIAAASPVLIIFSKSLNDHPFSQ